MKHNSSATGNSREALSRSDHQTPARTRVGVVLALTGVAAFSLSLPTTALALQGFGPWTATGLRGVIATAAALVALRLTRVPLPPRRYWPGLAVVTLGCVLGFPLFTTLALTTTTSGHSAVVIGLLPVTTASLASWYTRHNPGPLFWTAAALGALAVIVFTVHENGGRVTVADGYLVVALVLCAAGYVAGGQLARRIPGWQVIAWAVVFGAPVTVVAGLAGLGTEPLHPTWPSVAGLLYVGLVSQFGGFVPWYRGMALIGVPRASQLQLAQPLLNLFWSVVLLGEHVPVWAPVTAVVVIACIALTQRCARPATATAPRRMFSPRQGSTAD